MDSTLPGVTRRQFFNRSILGFLGLGVAGSGSAIVALLWPKISGAFGGRVDAGPVDVALATISEARAPLYVAAGRFYIVRAPEGAPTPVVALYQKCPHLGCRVPFCSTSQWFECPCHQSQYNLVGEKRSGPAPRGMDRFPVAVDDGRIVVDTSTVLIGPPIGTDTTGQEPQGPHCESESGAH